MSRRASFGSHHLVGMGAIATALSVYHMASNDGLLGLFQSANVPTNYSVRPSGIPTSYRGDRYLPDGERIDPNNNSQNANGQPNSFSSQGDSASMKPTFSGSPGLPERVRVVRGKSVLIM